MVYPASLDGLKVDFAGADQADVVDHAQMHNAERTAINAIEAELGTNPRGAAATVAARLAAIEADSRWTNARTPTAHKASHAAGGSDALSPADIGAATSAQGAKADTAVQSTLIDAKGDLLVGAAADNLMRLPAAADGRLLTTDGSQSVGVRWATPTTRVGTGSPLGIVTPDFVGQEWVDTQQTLGARKWVATGTTASSWVVGDGVTPWYNVQSLLVNGWAGTSVQMRRIGTTVEVVSHSTAGYALDGSAATSRMFISALPVGFRLDNARIGNYGVVGALWDGSALQPVSADGGFAAIHTPSRTARNHGTLRWITADPWPTAAPA